jgi:Resolvase, N terminal domain
MLFWVLPQIPQADAFPGLRALLPELIQDHCRKQPNAVLIAVIIRHNHGTHLAIFGLAHDLEPTFMMSPLRQENQVGFRALCDGAIDTTSASGELIFHIFSALAQFERRLIQERTRAGLAAARTRGKKGGRQPRHAGEPRVRMAYTMSVDQQLSVADICQTLRISQATFYRYVALEKRAAEGR